MQIREMGLSRRTTNCLYRAGITTVEELKQKRNWELQGIRSFGAKSFREVQEALERLEAEKTITNGVTVQQWIPVSERLPEPETEVLVLAEHKSYSFKTKGVTIYHIVTNGMYEDGTKNTEDSNWCWYDHDFKYDEELDAYIIPEGWWEYKHYNDDDEHNHLIDDTVTHWMPLPEPPKEG